ncbi:hypothetical protein EON66_12140 [archaeon]|nr:MAG: hypothetical protein EON66_12140 [archaeon]
MISGLLYGIYFGMLTRDVTAIAAESMNNSLGVRVACLLACPGQRQPGDGSAQPAPVLLHPVRALFILRAARAVFQEG